MNPAPSNPASPSFFRRWLTSLMVSALPVGNLCLFGPAGVYLANATFFAYPLESLLVPLLAASAAATLLLALLLACLPRNWFAGAVVITLALGVLTWIQGNFLLWDYGVLQGGDINWAKGRRWAWLGMLLWGGGLTAAWLWRKQFLPHARTLALAVLFLQLAGNGHAWWRMPPIPAHQRYSINYDRPFEFSPNRNVIVVLLDSFQSSTFAQLMAEHPDLRDAFAGFTFYQNTAAEFPRTLGAVPTLLTGRINRNEKPITEFVQEAYRDSVPGNLKNLGWRVDLYPWIRQTVHLSTKVADNFIPRSSLRLSLQHSLFLFDLGLFRQVPHVLKPLVFNKQNWLLSSGPGRQADQGSRYLDFLQFTQKLTASGKSKQDERPRFAYYHLQGAHAPFWFDANMEAARLPQAIEGYLEQATACLRLMARLFDHLCTLGIHDDALIVIVADHGGGDYNVPLPEYPGDTQSASPLPTPDHIRQGGTPLLAIKFPGQRSPLETSHRPVTLSDLPATLFRALNLPHAFPGRAAQDLKEHEARQRFHYHYTFDGWDQKYLPPLVEWSIDGHAWSATAWQPTGRVFSGQAHLSPEQLAGEMVDHEIKFGRHRAGNALLGSGWAEPDDNIVWSNNHRSTLTLTPPASRTPLLLEADLNPFVAEPRVPSQHVNVYLNGEHVAEWIARSRATYQAWVPAHLLNGRPLELLFELPDAISPQALGLGADVRQLGVALHSLRLQRLPAQVASGDWIPLQPGPDGRPEAVLWTSRHQPVIVQVLLQPGTGSKSEKVPWHEIVLDGTGDRSGPHRFRESLEIVLPTLSQRESRTQLTLHAPQPDRDADATGELQVRVTAPPAGQLGQVIALGAEDSSRYCLAGWSSREAGVAESNWRDFRWTDGLRASLGLRLSTPPPTRNLRFRFTGVPLLAGHVTAQRINLTVNGHPVASLTMDRQGTHAVEFPVDLLVDNVAVIAFELPDAISPAFDLHVNEDTRRLGLRMESFVLESVD